jgi:hypothetical protein
MCWCGNWFVSQRIADMAMVKADFVTKINNHGERLKSVI